MEQKFVAAVQRKETLRLKDVIRFASACVPDEYRIQPWKYFYQDTGRGRGTVPISDDTGILCYLAAYGNMHNLKIRLAVDEFLSSGGFPPSVNIIDWGCGQGLGSLAFLDHLDKNGNTPKVDNIILIEPSKLALGYAELYIKQRLKGMEVTVKTVCKYFADLKPEDLVLNGDAPVINIYSNILDVQDINMKELAGWLGSFESRDNYILAVSPYYYSGNCRMDTFFSYLRPVTWIGKGHLFESDKQSNQLGNFTYNIRTCKVTAETTYNIRQFKFFAPRQFFAAYRLDCFGKVDVKLYSSLTMFNVFANYEIGSSYKDDIDPIYAVLSNMISRGLPTKASPFIEENMIRVYECSTMNVGLGAISYDAVIDNDRLESASTILENKEYLGEDAPLILTPIAVARIEKAVVEALITGRLSVDSERWLVVVEEADVPCAALAFEELRQMFTNLVALSEDYRDRRFPKVDLHIVNAHYKESPLHLGNKVYSSSGAAPKVEYDLVIDYSSSCKGHEEYRFAKYRVKGNGCYLAIFSAEELTETRTIYTTDLIRYRNLTSTDPTGLYLEDAEAKVYLEYFLQMIFRKKSFRTGQLPILNRALRNQSVIGLLPTGGGKSLTYQLAAMLQPGVTIVIDPLRSLMQDQYDGLVGTGIDCCTFINSSVSNEERRDREYRIERSECLFAFMSPERLCIYSFRQRLKNMYDSGVYFSYGVIDEVHCVSEWGQDFRFSYLHLGRNLYNYVRSKTGVVTLFGLTATASFDVLADVERELSGNGAYTLDSDVLVRCEDTNRVELQYRIIPVSVQFSEDNFYDKNNHIPKFLPRPYRIDSIVGTEGKKQELYDIISSIPQMERELMESESIDRIIKHFYERQNKRIRPDAGESLHTEMPDDFAVSKESYPQAGIIFCPHKKNTSVSVEENAAELRKRIPDVGIFYSSDNVDRDSDDQPMENLVKFRDNHQSIMVATKAFGMGIDKPNVRFTINMNYSNSLEAFVQEAGRAGRDRAMALAVILVSDYNLIKLNRHSECIRSNQNFDRVKSDLENHWFREDDLDAILDYYGVSVNKDTQCTRCNPNQDLVKLKCDKNAEAFKKHTFDFNTGCKCQGHRKCMLETLKFRFPGWGIYSDLLYEAQQVGVRLIGRNIEYQSPDYRNMMYFYSTGYPGSVEEKRKMYELMTKLPVQIGISDNMEIPTTLEGADGFLSYVLSKNPGEVIVAIIHYTDAEDAAYSKAIYRMCCIGLIDDFTRDYSKKTYRVECVRKQDGGYYECLKDFLMRYYPEDKANTEVELARQRRGENEVQKCLGYLTEFIYEKLAVKKKRAIDDIRNFCNIGLEKDRDWKELNEDLKDYIYYYFNSKYAKEDYVADNGEPYSLTTDTDYGKESPLYVIDKYIKVTEDEVGGSSNPIDNVKHLQGAVRLILRSLTRENPVIELLNVFCILFLGDHKRNASIKQTLEDSYTAAYRTLWEQFEKKEDFYVFFADYKGSIFSHGADKEFREEMEIIEVNAETSRYLEFLKDLGWDRKLN